MKASKARTTSEFCEWIQNDAPCECGAMVQCPGVCDYVARLN